jgi:hypothetical protein
MNLATASLSHVLRIVLTTLRPPCPEVVQFLCIFCIPEVALGATDFAAYFAASHSSPIQMCILYIVIEEAGL